jgi:choloylglycine hydrolase
MKAHRPAVAALLPAFLLLVAVGLYPDCTSFRLRTPDAVYLCNNLDWYAGDGMLVVNKRGVSKKGCWFDNKPSWTSRYGSITINQLGREFPSRGMNEAGLTIVEMTLNETAFPSPDSRPALSTSQWMQYQLDCHSKVQEVIASDVKVRIDSGEWRSHFMVADRSGACATIEWIGGQMVTHTGRTLPVAVLSNDSYETCLGVREAGLSYGETDPSSLARFMRAADGVAQYNPDRDGEGTEYAFKVLTSVALSDLNQWNLVFDLTRLRFSFRTTDNRNTRYVDFRDFDFSPRTVVTTFPIYNQLTGDVHAFFADYDSAANRAMIFSVFDKLKWVQGDPDISVKETAARYPDTTKPR